MVKIVNFQGVEKVQTDKVLQFLDLNDDRCHPGFQLKSGSDKPRNH